MPSTADITNSVVSALQGADPVAEPGTVNLVATPSNAESAGAQSTASNSSPCSLFSLSTSRPSLRKISSGSTSSDISAEDGDATIARSVGRPRLTASVPGSSPSEETHPKPMAVAASVPALVSPPPPRESSQTGGSENTGERSKVLRLEQEIKIPVMRFDDIPTFDGTPETVSTMKKVFSAFEERVRGILTIARNAGDSSSTAKDTNAVLLSNMHYVLRGDAREFHDRLKAGEEAWEATPPPSALLVDAPAHVATIRPPSLWTEMRQAFIDRFLPAEGIARCAAALLTLRLRAGESVQELAARLLGLHNHLRKLTKRHRDKVSYCDAILMGFLEKGLPPDLLKAQRSAPACSSFQQCVDRAAHNARKFKNSAYHALGLEKAGVSLKRPDHSDQNVSPRGGSSSASTGEARHFLGKTGSSTSSRDVGQSYSTPDGDGNGAEVSMPVTTGAVGKTDPKKPYDSHEAKSASADSSRTPVNDCRLKTSETIPKHSASVPHHSLLPESCHADTPSANSQNDRVGQMAARKGAATRSDSEDLSPYAATRSPEMNHERERSGTPSNRTLLSGSCEYGFSAPRVPKKVRFDLKNNTRVLSLAAARSQRLGWMKASSERARELSAAGAIVEDESRDTPSESTVNGDDGGPNEELKDFSFFLQDYPPLPNVRTDSRKGGATSSDDTEVIPLPDAYKCIPLSELKAVGTTLLSRGASDPGVGSWYSRVSGTRFAAENASVIMKPLKRRKGGRTKSPTCNESGDQPKALEAQPLGQNKVPCKVRECKQTF